MLSPTKKVLEEYKLLVVKMNDDHSILATKTTLEFLCEVEVVMPTSFTFYPRWKQSMNSSSLFKVTMLLFVTLWGL